MVAHLLPKQVVAGSSPVSRSKKASHINIDVAFLYFDTIGYV